MKKIQKFSFLLFICVDFTVTYDYIDSMEERNTAMMTFEAINETTAVATNSLRKVEIVRQITDKFDRNIWMVYTPEGRLLDDVKVAGPFESYERAKREAECEVGMKIFSKDF